VVLLLRTGLQLGQDISGFCSCRFSCLLLREVCDVRGALIKCRVRALGVVEADPVIDDPFCLEAVGDFMQIDGLLFQGPP
jgi:hypothetical protein